jgi:hypothetical protein
MRQQSVATLAAEGNLASLESILRAQSWSKSAIKRHKDSELAKAPLPSKFYQWWVNVGLHYRWQFVVTTTIIAAALSLLVFCVAGALFFFGVPYALDGLALCGASTLTFVFLWTVSEWVANYEVNGFAQWGSRSYRHFLDVHGSVPPAVAELVDRVKAERQPGTFDIWIESLENQKTILDPILWIMFKNPETGIITDRYPALVWDAEGNILSPPTDH